MKKSRKRTKKLASKGKQLLKKMLHDPLVQEYVARQKKLATTTLRKVLKKVKRRIKV